MIREFEGKSEKEAIDNAVAELNLDREQFDVEIMESNRGGIFRKGNVKIRVYIEDDGHAGGAAYGEDDSQLAFGLGKDSAGAPAKAQNKKTPGREGRSGRGSSGRGSRSRFEEPVPPSRRDGIADRFVEEETSVETDSIRKPIPAADPQPQDEFEKKLVEFIETVTKKMGYPGRANIAYREPNKVGFNIDSEHSGILIGKKGKNLDSLQLLANIYAGRLDEGRRVVVDAENYRSRHEDSIIRNARRTAAQVRKSRRSRLLEPMNPFERRLVHTTLNDMNEIETKSEGDGLYKQVRIIYRGGSGGDRPRR